MLKLTSAVALLLAIGCGGGGNSNGEAGSCLVTANGMAEACVEYPAGEATQVMQTCSSTAFEDAGVVTQFVAGLCPRQNAVGGCQTTTDGETVTDWFYTPATMQSVQQVCSGEGGTFVSP